MKHFELVTDLSKSLSRFDLILNLSWLDVRQRYIRSAIGPFWISISSIISIISLSYIFSYISGNDFSSLISYLGVGYIIWIYISTALIDSCYVFPASEHIMKQLSLPLSIYVLRNFIKHLLILLHILILLPLLFFFIDWNLINILFFTLSFFLISINIFLICFSLAIIGSRYRDVAQIIQNFIQLMFFVTPIMWNRELFPKPFFIDFNPLFHFINLPREIILNNDFPFISLYVNIFIFFISFGFCNWLFCKYKNRIIFWI